VVRSSAAVEKQVDGMRSRIGAARFEATDEQGAAPRGERRGSAQFVQGASQRDEVGRALV
jgi:hypothetical protein